MIMITDYDSWLIPKYFCNVYITTEGCQLIVGPLTFTNIKTNCEFQLHS